MAFYYETENLRKDSIPSKYQTSHKPGEIPRHAGIYKCQACGYEDVINRECKTFPPCANCERKPHAWKLLVNAADE